MARWDRRFQNSTRGRVLALLRRGPHSVEQLAHALRITDNGIRVHLASLEHDGVVRPAGTRPTGGKPATLYEIAPEADSQFTRAHGPVLTQLVAVLGERLSPRQLRAVLDEVGRRLAASIAPPDAGSSLRGRVDAAARVLTDLGGVVDVERSGNRYVIQGHSCPLGDAVRTHPGTCRAVDTLVSEIVGRDVRECCVKGERPRCRFEVA